MAQAATPPAPPSLSLPLVAPLSLELIHEDPRKRLVLTVGSIDHLEADPMVVHPVVRVWLVDGLTGALLHTTDHSCGYYTQACDLRIRQILTPSWMEEILLDVHDAVLSSKAEAVLFFEVLDMPTENIKGERVYPVLLRYVAWGYLKLCDHRRRPNFARDLNVQLFRYPYERSVLRTLWLSVVPSMMYTNYCAAVPRNVAPPPPDTFVPPIFFIYMDVKNRLDEYPACLSVRIDVRPVSYVPIPPARHPREVAVYEDIVSVIMKGQPAARVTTTPRSRVTTPRSSSLVDGEGDILVPLESMSGGPGGVDPGPLLICGRDQGEPCASVGDMKYLTTLPGGTHGCAAVCFSPCGKYLACGISGEHCIVDLYDTRYQNFRRIYRYKGHQKTIYDVSFSPDSAYILSASADGTARVWSAVAKGANAPDAETFQSDDDGCVAALYHQSYLYTAVFLYSANFVATGSFDGMIRIWCVATAAEVRVLERQSSRIVRLVFDPSGSRLWSADASGVLSVWKLKNDVEANDVSTSERPRTTEMFLDRGILELQVLHGSTVLVQTGVDGCATILDAIGFRVRRRITGLPRSTAAAAPLATLTPDGRTLYCSTMNGNISAWDVTSGTHIGPVSGFTMHNTVTEETKEGVNPPGHLEESSVPMYRVVWSPSDNKFAGATFAAHINYVRLWCKETVMEDLATVSRSVTFSSSLKRRATNAHQRLSRSRAFTKSVFLEPSSISQPSSNDDRWSAIRQIVKKWGDAVQSRVAGGHSGVVVPEQHNITSVA
eukprot:PhF_6_TR6169/c0_g1_i1/m.9208/K16740/AHI1; jouberin